MKHYTFSNGLRVIYEQPKNTLPLTSIYVYCDVGSIHEPDSMKGAAHFIEHCVFKGTKKLKKSIDLFKAYDRTGANYNAFTEKRYTCYTIKCIDAYTGHCTETLADMLLHSRFPTAQILAEEQVVVEENIRIADSPEDDLANLTNSVLYSGTEFAKPIDTLDYHKSGRTRPKRFDRSSVVEMYNTYYRPDRMVFSIVSRIPFSVIVKMLKKTDFVLGDGHSIVPIQQILMKPIEHTSTTQYKLMEKRGFSTIHLNVSFRTCSQYSPDKHILSVVRSILSGTMGSRLFMVLREKNGLTYTSSATTEYYEPGGDFTIYTEVDRRKILKNGSKPGVLPLIMGIIGDLVKNGVSEEELTRIKDNLQAKRAMALEDSNVQTSHNGRDWLLYGDPDKIVPYADMYSTYTAPITRKQILEVVRKYFVRANMVVCMVGDGLPTLESVKAVCDKGVF